MGIIHLIILSIVEGLTEFIPVSSTAHILLTGRLLHIPSSSFLEAFSIAIQSGAILAAVFYFWKTVWNNLNLIPKVIVAFIPTGIAGILLYPVIKPLFDNTMTMAIALIIGGIFLLFLKPVDTTVSVKEISYKQAFLIGLIQIASFIPGTSRAGATLIGGTLIKIPRTLIVTFSFLLAIPTILGASVVEVRNVSTLTSQEYFYIAIGVLLSFVIALMTINFFINVLTKKPLSYFGWYRIVVGILVLIFV
jgi:undecaprenyl-diphosphatase